MIRVTFVCEFATRNGGENSLLSILPLLTAGGVDPFVICPTEGPFPASLDELGISHRKFVLFDDSGIRLPLETIRQQLTDDVLSTQPDIVHANSLSTSRICGGISDDIPVPIIGHVRDIMNVSAQVIRDMNELAAVISVSNATRDNLLTQGLSSEICEVVYNGVDAGLFVQADSDDIASRDSFVIGGVGQIGMRKGWDVLLDAFAKFAIDVPNCQLEICGERLSTKQEALEYETNLHARCERSDLEGKVSFCGYTDDIHLRMQDWDLLVHPARQEPLGRVLLEAAACGLPIVTTNVGGTPEIFPDGEAIVIEKDNAELLAQKITELHSNLLLRQQIGASARRRIQSQFTLERSANSILNVYRAVLGE